MKISNIPFSYAKFIKVFVSKMKILFHEKNQKKYITYLLTPFNFFYLSNCPSNRCIRLKVSINWRPWLISFALKRRPEKSRKKNLMATNTNNQEQLMLKSSNNNRNISLSIKEVKRQRQLHPKKFIRFKVKNENNSTTSISAALSPFEKSVAGTQQWESFAVWWICHLQWTSQFAIVM